MKSVSIAGHSVKMYDDISELPIVRFQKYCKYALYDSGIGGDLESFIGHLQRATAFIRTEPDKAISELENMRTNVSMIYNEINPANMAFACFVIEVDGKPFNDLSDDGIKKLLNKFSSEKQSIIDRMLESIKKKIQEEMKMYFPGNISEAREIQVDIQLRKRTIAELDRIILVCEEVLTGNKSPNRATQEALVRKLTDIIVTKDAPPIFSGTSAIDIKFDKDFETACMHVTKYMSGKDAKSLSTFAFYQALEDMKNEARKQGKKRRNKK